MKTQSTIGVFSKHLAAIIGFAFIFGFTHHASAVGYNYSLEISGIQTPVISFSYVGSSSTNDGVTATMVVKRYVEKDSASFLADQFTGTSLGTVILNSTLISETGAHLGFIAYKMSDCQIVSINEGGKRRQARGGGNHLWF